MSKLKYVSPTLEVLVVELEEGIAAGSAGATNEGLENWLNGPGGESTGNAS